MRIGELAKRTNVSRDTIRFYERHGLIRSDVDPKASNSYRDYPEETVLTLEVIQDAQAAGLSISDITVFVSQFMATPPDGYEGPDFLDQKIAQIEDRIASSQRFLEMLQITKAALAHAPQDGLEEIAAKARQKD